MMPKRLIVVLCALLLLCSCATKAPKQVGNPGDLYVEGVNLLKNKKYDDAIKKFSAIRENYPFDPMALIATVKLGDVYFAQKEYILAIGVYEDFFKSHPEDENIPYVLARLGECYDKTALSIDRDQSYILKSIERLTYLKNRYPASIHTKESEPRLARMLQKLADRELYVGEFYYRTDQYNASIMRLEYMLKKYPNAAGIDKALYYLSQDNRELGYQDKSDYYLERLKNDYPKSIYARAVTRQRKQLKLVKAEAPVVSFEERKKRNIELTPQQVAKAEPPKEEKDKGLSFFDEKKPIDIVSDSMEGFDKEKYVIFKGSVIAKQEDLFIFADVIEAYMSEDTNEIEKAYAKGNVKIVKQDRTATSEEAIFDNNKREITLKKNVVVISGQDRLTGELVTYYVNEDRVVVEGEKGKKARITVQPR
ncbi:MAG: Outer membrane protein assembly factor BamD precursor [Syntrophorhabdus sp. PtaU1.Bin058]|nr:MAG: Outer membrane protein assembly factor BamD precursor [Syntrophorhabdus sp. PtaU1.Bin058]